MKKEILKVASLFGTAFLLLLSGCGDGEKGDVEPSRKHHGKIADVAPATNRTASVHGKKKHKKRADRKKLSKKARKAQAKLLKKRAKAICRALNTPPPDLSDADKQTWLGLKEALDAEKFADVAEFAAAAQKSSSSDLRSNAVSALAWFGQEGLPELTSFLADSDEDVAGEAQRAWEAGLMEIDDDATKLQYIETAMSGISDELMLDAISQNYNQIADETAAVESIVRVAESGGKGAEKAKEAYEFITGEDWTSASDASAWVAEKRAEAAQDAAESEEGAEGPDSSGGAQEVDE